MIFLDKNAVSDYTVFIPFEKEVSLNMKDLRILTVQDISCVGQCSLTVALPILSACGIETAILPSAVLSTHTGGFHGFTFRDLTDDLPAIAAHWQKENINFDAIYTGYLGSARQIDEVTAIMNTLLADGGLRIVDPAMADNGKLYVGFDAAFVEEMKKLVFSADIILPNITEACLLTDSEYKEEYDRAYTDLLIEKMVNAGAKKIVLTGVSYRPGKTGVLVCEDGKQTYYEHEHLKPGCHGTGDVYASAFVGALLRGKTLPEAAKIAADYVLDCITYTHKDPSHWYGVHFEACLPGLIRSLEN